jgi:hypothetical protein
MLMGMSREPLQTVTLPLLVDADTPDSTELGCAKGECAVFTSHGHTRLQKVRVIGSEALVQWVGRDTRSGLARALRGLGLLQHAYATRNATALRAAIAQSRPLLPKPQFGKVTEDWTGDKIWGGAQWFYSEAMSHAIKNARWVAWWPFSGEQEALPGVYCPDMSTAVAMALFIQDVRVCPKCGVPFVPKQENVDYCKPAHGVAYRTARSRERKRTPPEPAKSPKRTQKSVR